MSAPDLTPADLDALAALYDLATPGEWTIFNGSRKWKTFQIDGPSKSAAGTNESAIVHWAGFDSGDRAPKIKRANAESIVALHNAFPALLRLARSAEGLKHGGECLTDPYTKDVCEGMYAEKVDEVLALVQTLEGIATLSAGYSQESKELRKFALQGIAAQSTDIDAAGEARSELAAFDAAGKPK